MNYLLKLSIGLMIFVTLFGCNKNKEFTKESIATVTKQNQLVFIWSFNALLNQKNGGSNRIFGGEVNTTENDSSYREVLGEWWDITDKKSLETTIVALTNGNVHNTSFKTDFTAILNGSKIEFQKELLISPEYKELMIELWKNKTSLKQHGIIAWDQIRAIGIIGWGYQAGYISKDEAYSFCMKVGSKLQSYFKSYDEMIANYNLGRFFWSNNVGEYNTDKIMILDLLNDPTCIWNVFPFDYDLSRKEL